MPTDSPPPDALLALIPWPAFLGPPAKFSRAPPSTFAHLATIHAHCRIAATWADVPPLLASLVEKGTVSQQNSSSASPSPAEGGAGGAGQGRGAFGSDEEGGEGSGRGGKSKINDLEEKEVLKVLYEVCWEHIAPLVESWEHVSAERLLRVLAFRVCACLHPYAWFVRVLAFAWFSLMCSMFCRRRGDRYAAR